MRCTSTSKKAPFSKTSTELPWTPALSVRPASEGISSSIGELHSMCSLGSRWRLIDQMTIDKSKITQTNAAARKMDTGFIVSLLYEVECSGATQETHRAARGRCRGADGDASLCRDDRAMLAG